MAGGSDLEHPKMRRGLSPSTIFHGRCEDNRGVLPLDLFDRTVGGPVASNRYDRLIAFHAVEADGSTIVHREPDTRAVWSKSPIYDSGKGLREIDAEAGQVENCLRGRDAPHE